MNSRVNPFREVIVSDARQTEPVVPGLNELPLNKLRERFAALRQGAVPRALQHAERALLVFSEEPGYGKSHLIARLFRELHGQASLIYVYPFQNPRAPFQSLMLALVREMHFPDRETTGAWNRDNPSQLDQLAHAVLAHIVADLIEGAVEFFEIGAPADAASILRANPMEAFERGRGAWGAWLNEYWPKLENVFEPALANRGLQLHRPRAWLRVLRSYAFAPFDPYVRRICTDWMCGQPFDGEEAAKIGLQISEGNSADASPEDTNELCRERLRDVCELAAYFRPFVFCFDQTEVYCGSHRLAHAFGMVVATLVNEVRGHMTMVTANQAPWTNRLRPHLEDADLARFEQPPIYLQALNRAQAGELVRLRMRAFSLEESEATHFLGGDWFQNLFPTENARLGARAFLERCGEKWAGSADVVDLETLFAERRDKILATPKRHAFEPDTLQWLVEVAGQGLKGVKVSSTQEKYALVKWETAHRTVLFGFLSGSNWNQWLAVAKASQVRIPGATRPVKYVFFRVPGQPVIPGEKWVAGPEIERAKAETLHIVNLTLDELADLYAPRDLFADAAQGDIPASTDDVIAFIQGSHEVYWRRFQEAISSDRSPLPAPSPEDDIPRPGPLTDEVSAVVEKVRFLSIEELISRLSRPGVTREAVLEAVGFCSEIRLHTHPNMTVLQWLGKG